MASLHKLFISFECLLVFMSIAQAKPVVPDLKKTASAWDGSQIQLGLNINTGNTDAAELNSVFGLDYAKNRWENALDLTAAYAKSQNVLNKKKYTAKDQVKYGFDVTRRHFLFVRGGWVNDYFSPYSYQSTVAMGYGRDIINRSNVVVSVQAGPGYRNDRVRGTGAVEERIIGTFQMHAKVAVSKNGVLKEVLQYDSGPPFHYVDSNTSFSSKFMTHWALKVAIELEYYSRIPPMSDHTEKLDTTTIIALVYNF